MKTTTQNGIIKNNELQDKFEFRDILPEEGEQTAEIERICFPPNEACFRKMMLERVAKAPEMFLVAVDRNTGKIAGFLNGLATSETQFRDEFFTDADLYEPDGQNIMLLGLDVLPEYRGQGLATELMRPLPETGAGKSKERSDSHLPGRKDKNVRENGISESGNLKLSLGRRAVV